MRITSAGTAEPAQRVLREDALHPLVVSSPPACASRLSVRTSASDTQFARIPRRARPSPASDFVRPTVEARVVAVTSRPDSPDPSGVAHQAHDRAGAAAAAIRVATAWVTRSVPVTVTSTCACPVRRRRAPGTPSAASPPRCRRAPRSGPAPARSRSTAACDRAVLHAGRRRPPGPSTPSPRAYRERNGLGVPHDDPVAPSSPRRGAPRSARP